MQNTTHKAVVLMNLSAFFSGMVFYAPVATLYRQSRGISVWQMSLIEALSLALMMALEIPWGYVADRIGYRRTLVFSFLVLFISKIVFFAAHGFSLFLMERILLAIAFSALSGVDIAYLHRCNAGQKEFGYYQGSSFLGLLVVALIFPLFSEIFVQSAFLTIVSHLIALLFILALPREPVVQNILSSHYTGVVETLGCLARDRLLLLYVSGNTLLFGVNQVVTVFLVQLCYTKVGLPLSAFGLPFLLLVITSSTVSYLSSPLTSYFGRRALTLFSFVLSLSGLALLWSMQGVVVVVLGAVLVRLGATLVQPVYLAVTAKACEGPDLATSLSMNSLIGSLMELFLTLGLGFLAERNLSLALGVASIALALGLGLLFCSRSLLSTPNLV